MNETENKSLPANIAYEEIRKNILNGGFAPGHRLVVTDLAAAWDIDGAPVKEALNRLVSEGLVEFEPHRSMRVRHRLTPTEVREKFELRAILEEYCCRQVTSKIAQHPEVLDRLVRLLKDMKNLLGSEEHAQSLYRLDGEFHSAIILPCDNSEIVRQINLLSAEILAFAMLASHSFPLRRQAITFEEHREIVSALAHRDVDEAGEAMRRHLLKSRDHLLNFHDRTSGQQEERLPNVMHQEGDRQK